MKILKTLLCGMLVMSAIATSASANDIIDPQYGVATIAESNEIANDYDVIFTSGTYGWGERLYSTGGWFTNADATTEVWGDDGTALADQSPYAYVFIENTNDGTEDEADSDTMNTNRYCQAYGELDGSDYATSVDHEASLTVYGDTDFERSVTISG